MLHCIIRTSNVSTRDVCVCLEVCADHAHNNNVPLRILLCHRARSIYQPGYKTMSARSCEVQGGRCGSSARRVARSLGGPSLMTQKEGELLLSAWSVQLLWPLWLHVTVRAINCMPTCQLEIPADMPQICSSHHICTPGILCCLMCRADCRLFCCSCGTYYRFCCGYRSLVCALTSQCAQRKQARKQNKKKEKRQKESSNSGISSAT